MSASKGPRARLTVRMPQELLIGVDRFGAHLGTDRNDAILTLISLGFQAYGESTTAPRAPISGGDDSS